MSNIPTDFSTTTTVTYAVTGSGTYQYYSNATYGGIAFTSGTNYLYFSSIASGTVFQYIITGGGGASGGNSYINGTSATLTGGGMGGGGGGGTVYGANIPFSIQQTYAICVGGGCPFTSVPSQNGGVLTGGTSSIYGALFSYAVGGNSGNATSYSWINDGGNAGGAFNSGANGEQFYDTATSYPQGNLDLLGGGGGGGGGGLYQNGSQAQKGGAFGYGAGGGDGNGQGGPDYDPPYSAGSGYAGFGAYSGTTNVTSFPFSSAATTTVNFGGGGGGSIYISSGSLVGIYYGAGGNNSGGSGGGLDGNAGGSNVPAEGSANGLGFGGGGGGQSISFSGNYNGGNGVVLIWWTL